MVAELPVGIASPLERLAAIRTQMEGLKQSHQAVAANVLVNMADFAPPMLMTLGLRSAATLMRRMPQASVNTVTTNVPGPQVPLYACGREMLSYYPFVPLSQGVRIGVAILSYNGRIAFGVTGDWDTTADLDVMTDGIEHGIAELTDAAIAATAAAGAAPPDRPQAGGEAGRHTVRSVRKQAAKRGTTRVARTATRRRAGRRMTDAGTSSSERMSSSSAPASSAARWPSNSPAGAIRSWSSTRVRPPEPARRARRGRRALQLLDARQCEAVVGVGTAVAAVGRTSRRRRRCRPGAILPVRHAGPRLARRSVRRASAPTSTTVGVPYEILDPRSNCATASRPSTAAVTSRRSGSTTTAFWTDPHGDARWVLLPRRGLRRRSGPRRPQPDGRRRATRRRPSASARTSSPSTERVERDRDPAPTAASTSPPTSSSTSPVPTPPTSTSSPGSPPAGSSRGRCARRSTSCPPRTTSRSTGHDRRRHRSRHVLPPAPGRHPRPRRDRAGVRRARVGRRRRHFDEFVTLEVWERQTTRVARRLPTSGCRPARPDWLRCTTCPTTGCRSTTAPISTGYYVAIGTSGNQFKNAPMVGLVMTEIIEACEAGHDHDASPVAVRGPVTGNVIDLGHFSRRRTAHRTSNSVLG